MATGPSLPALPAELRSIIFDFMVDGSEAQELSDLLCTCSEVFNEVQYAISKGRHAITHVVDAGHWRQITNPSRTQVLSEAMAVNERQNVHIVKFIGNDNNIVYSLWRTDWALDSLSHHQIQPKKVVLQYAYSTPNLAGTDIGNLVDAVDHITRLVSRIERIVVCNVPQNLLFFLACQMFNLMYVPNMDINAMSDSLLAELSLNNGEWCEVTLQAPVQLGGPAVRDVVIRITMLDG